MPELLSQIPPDQHIASVTADGAYDTRKCYDAIAERGARAVTPPRKNAKPWKAITAGAGERNEALRAAKYLGRALSRRWSGYHCRGRVEKKMHCVKFLGQRLMARDFERQVDDDGSNTRLDSTHDCHRRLLNLANSCQDSPNQPRASRRVHERTVR